jgi:hypothetical protein
MVKQYVEGIRAAGVEHAFVSSDTGQVNSNWQPDALANCAKVLRANGFTEHELDLLLKINPAKNSRDRAASRDALREGRHTLVVETISFDTSSVGRPASTSRSSPPPMPVMRRRDDGDWRREYAKTAVRTARRDT